jgi:hypothetical protein
MAVPCLYWRGVREGYGDVGWAVTAHLRCVMGAQQCKRGIQSRVGESQRTSTVAPSKASSACENQFPKLHSVPNAARTVLTR